MNTRKTIRISMIALLVVALSVSMAAAAAPSVWAENETGYDMTSSGIPFGYHDKVYVSGYGTTGTSANVYVVPERTWTNGEKMTDFGGTVGYIIKQANVASGVISAPNSVYIGTVGTASGEIPAGDYDIFYDIDNDGTYTVNVDTVEHEMQCKGFSANVPEFATIAIPAIALLGLVFFMRRKKD